MYASLARLSLLSLFLGVALASPLASGWDPAPGFRLEPRQTVPPTNCSKAFHVIAAGGCKQPCPMDPTPPTFLGNLIPDIAQRFPGSDHYWIPYDNSNDQVADSDPLAVQAAYNYVASCPNTPIVFFGYSLGAVVLMDAICGKINNLRSHVIAAVMYGDETFVANQTYDVSTCKQNAPKYPRKASTCKQFANILQSYCLSTDSECCSGGTDGASHFNYAQFNNNTINYIGAQYAAWNQYHGISL